MGEVMRRPPTQQKLFRPRFAPGPWQPRQNIPREFRTMAPALVRSHVWPKQDRGRVLAALRGSHRLGGAYQIDEDTFFLPRESTQNATRGYPQYASGPVPVTAVTKAQRHLAHLQEQILRKHVGGGRLTPVEAREAFSVRVPEQVTIAELNAQTGYTDPCLIISRAQAKAFKYGTRAGARPAYILRNPAARARQIAASVADRQAIGGSWLGRHWRAPWCPRDYRTGVR